MPSRRDSRPEFVVELEVQAIAVLSVHAESAEEACATAESRVRPADVTELGDVETLRIVRVGEAEPRVLKTRGRRSAQTAAKGADRAGQA
jgi:hypothetical protein